MKPRARDDVLLRQLEVDEWVLYDPVTRQMHVMNRTAALVWLHCTGELEEAAIVEALQGVFGNQVTRAQLADDVARTLADYARLGVLQ